MLLEPKYANILVGLWGAHKTRSHVRRIADILRSQIGLIRYAILNYVDKFLTFAIPLVVLYVFKDKAIYNEIEYIYSIAAVAAVVLELGVSNYFLYAYRQADDRDRLVENVKGCLLLQLSIYLSFGVLLVSAAFVYGLDITVTYLYILVRTLYMYFLSFFVIYYRLIDNPSKVFVYSFCVNLTTILLLVAVKIFVGSIDLVYLFLSQMVLLLATFGYYLYHRSQTSLSNLVSYLKQSLAFAWPIILNIFLFMFISNYGKIYARNFLSGDDMFQISFVQRAAIIIQLAHASAVGYLSKRIFIDHKAGINPRVLALYSIMMTASVGLVLFLFLTLNFLRLAITVEINAVTLLIVAYTVAWCYVAYFELYVNRMNKNKYILLFSCVASVVFVTVLLLNLGTPLYTISLGMMVSMLCNLAMVLWFLRWKHREIWIS